MKKTITTAVAVLALGSTLAFAAPHGNGFGGRHHGRGAFGAKLAEKLDLSEAQKQQIRDIRKASREANQAFFESARATFQEFRAAKKANDTAKVESLKPAVEANRAQLKQLREQEKAKIAAILTPEQQQKLAELRAQREARRGNRQ